MPKKTGCGVLFAVLVSALLIAGICFNATEGVAYASSGTEVDNVPPTTSHDYDGAWHTSNFTITLTATDHESNVAKTYYRINDEPIKTVSVDGQPLITEESVNNMLKYWSVDNAGNQETPKMLTDIKLDKTVPTGSITINDGAASTTSTQVKLTLSAEDATSGVAQMRFFDRIYGDWEEYATSKLWTFQTGDAYKTVYVQFRDNAGLVSAPYPATIYFGSTPPSDPPLARDPEKPEKPQEKPLEKSPEKPQENIVPKETAPPKDDEEAFPLWIVILAAATIGIVIATVAAAVALLRLKRK
jgi:hypothetical protein